jgi:hypothetical protein
MRETTWQAIQERGAMIMLDGLDEVSREKYTTVTKKIRNFSQS